MTDLTPAIIVTCGLLCDIFGAYLIAKNILKPFASPYMRDIGDSGTLNGGALIIENPDYKRDETSYLKSAKFGFYLLLFGFVLQGVGTW
ncbi:hypothetical protein [Nitrosospira multiformis]|uniref:Uncharacterized protein n=1 Tax=Nitrosospira multiformis TaxID=1231 RepID=A0A1I7IKK5_9PROT|nr:hypothetical protein [Nitrosospira multiformis]SFU73461.1 hypothetical protein SAMN05216417_1212 [Nitrosospira multiformis]